MSSVILTACATYKTRVRPATVDGQKNYYLKCAGIAVCREEAARMCPAGYEVISEEGATAAGATTPTVGRQNLGDDSRRWIFNIPQKATMHIVCVPPAPAIP